MKIEENDFTQKQIIAIKFAEFNGLEILLDFTNLDKSGEFTVTWDNAEFKELELNFTEQEMHDIIMNHVTQSFKDFTELEKENLNDIKDNPIGVNEE